MTKLMSVEIRAKIVLIHVASNEHFHSLSAAEQIPRDPPPQQSKTGIAGDPGPARKPEKALARNGPSG
jgi:hypothetical protein